MVLTMSETMEAQQLQEAARRYWDANDRLGYTLSGAKLGEKYERSERWGRDRIAEVRLARKTSSPVELPLSLPPVVTPQTVTEPAPAPSPMPVPAPEPSPVPEPEAPVVGETPATAEPAPRQEPTAEPASTPAHKALRVWPVWLLMAPAAVAIWGGWVGLGELAGFGPVRLLPGIYDHLVINTAITLPIGMETYAAYALYVWLSGRAQGKARRMARNSAWAAITVGALGQIAYHVMAAAGVGVAPWWVTAGVACLPVAVLGMGAALAHMVRAESDGAVSLPSTAAAAV
jgi:hypothetical protein